jgi:hypothetical protein
VSVVFCEMSGFSLVQRSPTEGGVSECDREALPHYGLLRNGKTLPTVYAISNVWPRIVLGGGNWICILPHTKVTVLFYSLRHYFVRKYSGDGVVA